MLLRPRRNRKTEGLRALVREVSLSASHLVLPLFVQEGQGQATPIASMRPRPTRSSTVGPDGTGVATQTRPSSSRTVAIGIRPGSPSRRSRASC
jgi:hypothetical protein